MNKNRLPDISLLSVMGQMIRENPDWTHERLDAALNGYKEFLALCRERPTETQEPTADVDKVWHAHILHTEDYAEFCEKYFSYFLHHRPYLEGAEVTTFALSTCSNPAALPR